MIEISLNSLSCLVFGHDELANGVLSSGGNVTLLEGVIGRAGALVPVAGRPPKSSASVPFLVARRLRGNERLWRNCKPYLIRAQSTPENSGRLMYCAILLRMDCAAKIEKYKANVGNFNMFYHKEVV